MSYDIYPRDTEPCVSKFYQDIDSDYKINKLDTTYFDYEREEGKPACPRLKAVFPLLCNNFDLYYATREIGGNTEYDFYCMMQSCLNRHADTLERHLMVYDDDIANPILGRTEKVTYDTLDSRESTSKLETTYGSKEERTIDTTEETTYNSGKTTDVDGNDTIHHVDVPVDVAGDNPPYDVDRTRDRTEFDHTTTEQNSGSDSIQNDGTDVVERSGTDKDEGEGTDNRAMTGTVTTELSDLGVRPNYESLNGFLDNNRTFIQEFINVFEECFSPRYQRVVF